MKKITAALLVMVLCLGLAACGGSDNSDASTTDTEGSTSTTETEVPAETSTKDEVAYEVTYTNARAYENSIGTTWVQTIIEVTNTGSEDLYLNSGSYDLEDAEGNLIASQTLVSVYPQIISSGEKAYYYEETTLDKDVDAETLIVVARPDAKKATVANIELTVTDFELTDATYGELNMLGRVENTTDESQDMIYIAAILFNADGNPIGQMFTILNSELAAGDKIGFESVSWTLPDDITVDGIASYEIFAYPHQYQF